MSRERVENLIRKLKNEPDALGEISAVRERVFNEVRQNAFHRGPSAHMMRAFVAVLILSGVLTGSATFAQNALPGDVLYPMKRATEEIWVALHVSPDEHLAAEQVIIERRFNEISATKSTASEAKAVDAYVATVRAAAVRAEKIADKSDPDMAADETEKFSHLIERHANQFERNFDRQNKETKDKKDGKDKDERRRVKMENVYIEGMLKVDDAMMKINERRRKTPQRNYERD